MLYRGDSQNLEEDQVYSYNLKEAAIASKAVTKSRASDKFKQPALHYNHEKAGMADIDKDRVQRMIMEASKGSDYYNREVKRSEQAKEKAKELRKKIDLHRQNERLWRQDQATVRSILSEIEQSRELTRTWSHIDMDMFFAAVEIRDDPSLADKPVAVGGQMMISTANYVARKFGVRSAMPGFIARKLCPELVFVDCNFKKYKAVSKVFQGILAEYDPQFESMGCDEANMDLTNYLAERGLDNDEGRQQVVKEIRTRVEQATQLTCSAGISCNKMLAKICTDMKKPDGQTYLRPDTEEILTFMRKLSVRKIPGIGRMTELVLASLDIFTCADVLEHAVEIYISFSERLSTFLFRAALGISRNFHEEDDDDACQKSISVSSTFKPLSTLEQFREKISEMCEELAERIDKRKVAGLTVTLELKSVKYEVVQKSMTVKGYIWQAEELQLYCYQILDTVWPVSGLFL